MKKLAVLLMVLFAANIFAQEYVVEKLSGKVLVQKGTNENWETVYPGEKLNGDALVLTDKDAYVQLNKKGTHFLISANSALGLNHIKKISTNDLLLALAMEEIRNVPKLKSKGESKSTAVYGSEVSGKNTEVVPENDLGIKKLNGAKILAENGYKKSGVIVAKETYRKYPVTKKQIKDRIYFADILYGLGLYQEAAAEYADIEQQPMSASERKIVDKKIEEVNLKLAK